MDKKLFDAMSYLYSATLDNDSVVNENKTHKAVKHFRYLKRWIRAHGGDVPVR